MPIVDYRLRARLEAVINSVLEPMIDGTPAGPTKWKSAERDVRVALEPFLRARLITALHVRCDAETNQDRPEDIAVEVVVNVPKRVAKLVLRVGTM